MTSIPELVEIARRLHEEHYDGKSENFEDFAARLGITQIEAVLVKYPLREFIEQAELEGAGVVPDDLLRLTPEFTEMYVADQLGIDDPGFVAKLGPVTILSHHDIAPLFGKR